MYYISESRGDSVIQLEGQVTATEGESVTLHCKFETTDPSPYLFWYKQEVKGFPKYVLMRLKYGSGDNVTEFKERFDAALDSSSFPLSIQRLQLSDSAVYYCALRHTVITGHTAPVQKHIMRHKP